MGSQCQLKMHFLKGHCYQFMIKFTSLDSIHLWLCCSVPASIKSALFKGTLFSVSSVSVTSVCVTGFKRIWSRPEAWAAPKSPILGWTVCARDRCKRSTRPELALRRHPASAPRAHGGASPCRCYHRCRPFDQRHGIDGATPADEKKILAFMTDCGLKSAREQKPMITKLFLGPNSF